MRASHVRRRIELSNLSLDIEIDAAKRHCELRPDTVIPVISSLSLRREHGKTAP